MTVYLLAVESFKKCSKNVANFQLGVPATEEIARKLKSAKYKTRMKKQLVVH